MVTIDFHVHYYPKELHKNPKSYLKKHRMELLLKIMPQEFWRNVMMHFDSYFEYMEKYSIDKAVIFGTSNTPEGCREMNDAVYKIIERYPNRFLTASLDLLIFHYLIQKRR